MKNYSKAVLPVVGGLASFFAICWIVYLVWQNREGMAELDFPSAKILAYAFLYAFSLLLLAWNWAELVGLHDDKRGAPRSLLCASFLESQAWKYLPGNVFHYVGRHLAGKNDGASSTALFKATITESVSLVTAALAVAAVGLLMSDLEAFQLLRDYVFLPVALVGSLCLAFLLFLTVRTWQKNMVGPWLLVPIRAVAFMTLLGALACLISGDFSNAGAIIGATALAWVVGFLTPGSPGGLGSREVALLILLTPVLGETQVLGLSIILRAVTFGGDVLSSILGAMLGEIYRRKNIE